MTTRHELLMTVAVVCLLQAATAGGAPPLPHPDAFGPHLGPEYASAAASLTSTHSQHPSNYAASVGPADVAGRGEASISSSSSSSNSGGGGDIFFGDDVSFCRRGRGTRDSNFSGASLWSRSAGACSTLNLGGLMVVARYYACVRTIRSNGFSYSASFWSCPRN